MTQSRWKPLLDEPRRSKALAEVSEIAAELIRYEPTKNDPQGRVWNDLAVFFAYLDRVLSGAGHAERAVHFLELAAERLSDSDCGFSLYAGFAGVGWTTAHLQGTLLDSDEEAVESVDSAVLEVLKDYPEWAHFDLINGLVGLAVYAYAGRNRSTAGEMLELIVERLLERCERQNRLVTWKTSAQLLTEHDLKVYPNGLYNLGVAHGIPGIAWALAAAHLVGVPKAKPLLEEVMPWILEHGRDSANGLFAASMWDHPPRAMMRAGWCYGDPGASFVLWRAACAIARDDWATAALDGVRRAATLGSSGTTDAPLCHGAAGAMQIFNRLYQATGDDLFLNASTQWFENTLSEKDPGQFIAGYGFMCRLEGKLVPRAGLLEGVVGIGLALLAAATDIEPAWDQLLLLANW